MEFDVLAPPSCDPRRYSQLTKDEVIDQERREREAALLVAAAPPPATRTLDSVLLNL
ncbi:hypothetical protein U1Q18_014796, partial [Sarracenia purpurea var. burkii]